MILEEIKKELLDIDIDLNKKLLSLSKNELKEALSNIDKVMSDIEEKHFNSSNDEYIKNEFKIFNSNLLEINKRKDYFNKKNVDNNPINK